MTRAEQPTPLTFGLLSARFPAVASKGGFAGAEHGRWLLAAVAAGRWPSLHSRRFSRDLQPCRTEARAECRRGPRGGRGRPEGSGRRAAPRSAWSESLQGRWLSAVSKQRTVSALSPRQHRPSMCGRRAGWAASCCAHQRRRDRQARRVGLPAVDRRVRRVRGPPGAHGRAAAPRPQGRSGRLLLMRRLPNRAGLCGVSQCCSKSTASVVMTPWASVASSSTSKRP